MRPATLARVGLGGCCLAAPRRVLGLIGGPDRDEAEVVVVTRVLGARLLLQGVGDVLLGPRLRRPGIAVELTHAASMLLVAAYRPDHRRTTLVSAGAAACLAVLDLRRSAGRERDRPLQLRADRS